MSNALRKTGEPSGKAAIAHANGRTEPRPVDAGTAVVGGYATRIDADVMVDPLHPMHRELLARMSGAALRDDRLPRPQRLAIVFYAAIGAWGLVWLIGAAVLALL